MNYCCDNIKVFVEFAQIKVIKNTDYSIIVIIIRN